MKKQSLVSRLFIVFLLFFLLVCSVWIIFGAALVWGVDAIDTWTTPGVGLLVVALAFPLYGMFVTWMYFFLQDLFLTIRPPKNTTPVPVETLYERLKKSFTQAKREDGSPLYEVLEKRNELVITWSNKIVFNQILSFGAQEKRRLYSLRFFSHDARVDYVNTDIDWSTSVSPWSLAARLSFFRGVSAEWSGVYIPSFTMQTDGTVQWDPKKIRYNSMDIWQPIEDITTSAGWTLRPGWAPRWFRISLVIFMGIILGPLIWVVFANAQ